MVNHHETTIWDDIFLKDLFQALKMQLQVNGNHFLGGLKQAANLWSKVPTGGAN